MSNSFPSGTGLVVPVRLDALMIGGGDQDINTFVPGYARFNEMAYPGNGSGVHLSGELLQQPFQGAMPLPQGIHLHWNLPRSLRTVDCADFNKPMKPRPVPNRWLVTRTTIDVSNPEAPVTAFAHWVLESDSLDTADGPTTIPWEATDQQPQPWRSLGRVFSSVEDWLANGGSGEYVTQLTALGFGIPDFASCYTNCQNVFGMCDSSLNDSGAAGGTTLLAYSVTGWYSNPADDPLSGANAAQTATDYGWTYDTQAGTPSFTLCHGMVFSLPWSPEGTHLSGGSISPAIALGNTPADAFAAYAAAALGSDGPTNVEGILNALQLGLLPNLGQADASALLGDRQFGATFTRLDGGPTWGIRSAAGADTVPADSPIVQDMGSLIGQQDQLNRIAKQATSLQAQIFADWSKYMLVYYANSEQGELASQTMSFVEKEVRALKDLQTQINSLQSQIKDLQQKIAQALPAGLTLVQYRDGRYFGPNDPVVVLTGDGIPGTPADDADTIDCVLTTGLASAIHLPAGLVVSSAAVSLPVTALPQPAAATAAPLPIAMSLVQTDLLLVPSASAVIAATVAALGGSGNPAVDDFTGTSSAIGAAQQAWQNGSAAANGITLTGEIPEPAVGAQAWTLPWRPIALAWQCAYTPLQPLDLSTAGQQTLPALPPDVVTSHFAATTAGPDLAPTSLAFGGSTTLQGTALLSSDATLRLQNGIAAYLKTHPDPEFETLLIHLGNTPVLTQALSGFSSDLLMLKPNLQLPVGDSCANDPTNYGFSNKTVAEAVGDQNLYTPEVAFSPDFSGPLYNPLRAGRISLTQLNVIDEFGRFQTVDVSRIHATQAMPPTPVETGQAFLLPLRLTQPARLTFRWLAAADPGLPACGLLATNPICGWVVPSSLDDSLMYYDASGAAIGSQTAADTVVWQVAPGSDTPGESMAQSFSGRNPVLSRFATAVQSNGPAYLQSLLRTITEAQIFVQPQSYQLSRQTAVLIGSPLALVQAGLALELLGQPSPDQSFAALEQDMKGSGARTTRGLEQVSFPVVLGDAERLNDGLIGYFLSDASGQADFTKCYSAMSDGSSGSVVKPSLETLQLTLDSSNPTLVAMLMDPRSVVHAATGILPVEEKGLPAKLYAAALANLAYSFLTAPILAPAGTFALPTPQEASGTWSWVTFQNDAWTSQPITAPTGLATLQRPQGLQEGWLRLVPSKGTP